MAEIKYVGKSPNSDSSVVTRLYVDDTHTSLAVTNAIIDDESTQAIIDNELVLPSYVDAADATKATKAAVDAADANYIPIGQKDAPNGVPTLDAGNFVKVVQLPTVMTDRPYVIVNATVLNDAFAINQAVSSNSQIFLASISVTDPGFPYIPMVFARVQCLDAASGPLTSGAAFLQVFDSSGNTIGAGLYFPGSAQSTTGAAVGPVAWNFTTGGVLEGSTSLSLYGTARSGTPTYSPNFFAFGAVLFPAK